MSKLNEKALSLFEKNSKQGENNFQESFEVNKAQPLNNFNAIFGIAKLSKNEEETLQQILLDNVEEEKVSQKQLNQDLHALVEITSQIRAIDRQGILLHGERIERAKDLLKLYKYGAFSAWLRTAYGNRQTPYSILQYFQLYKEVPKDVQPLIQAMPRKAVYQLAARAGSLHKKIDIVKKYYDQPQSEIITVIQESFPLQSNKQPERKMDEGLIDTIRHCLTKLLVRKTKLSDQNKEALSDIKHLLEQILAS
jgi:hypothetical protein